MLPRALRPATPSRPGFAAPRLRPRTAKPLPSARSPAATPPSSPSDPPPPPMTVEEACDTLGVTELTPFDEVVAAKAAKLGGATGEEAEKVRMGERERARPAIRGPRPGAHAQPSATG